MPDHVHVRHRAASLRLYCTVSVTSHGQRLQAERWLGARADELVWCTAASGWSKSARNAFIAPWLRGAAALLHDARFDPHERLELLERERVAVLCMAPTEYRAIAKRARAAARSRRCAGSSPRARRSTPACSGRWHDATGLWIRDGYGQTETGQLTGMPLGERARPGSMGRPLPGHLARASSTASSCSIRPATRRSSSRYLGEEPPAGPWRTGDRVHADEDGFLYFEGRADDVIVSAGYRIGPFEVESVLAAHPAVAEAAVVAAPDDERGSVVRAVVVLRAGHAPSEALARELQEHVKAETAPYKYPRIVDFAAELPRTPSGKVRRAALRAGDNRTPGRCSVAHMTITLDETAIDPARVAALTELEKAKLVERTRRSGEYFARASAVMPGGVPSQFQKNDPWPVYIERGEGARVWDVDGNEYVDFHNGFGVMCVGHANPVIAAAVKARMDEGTHFAAPTEGSIVVAEELKRRWGLPHWRFTNSGTESTMDAVHLARGATGNDVIVKIEGTYHGHHDAVMVSVKPPAELMGERERPNAVPYGLGYPSTTASQTQPVPFNDADVLERILDELDGQVAGVILEPAMMNINIVPPAAGLPRARARARDGPWRRADLRRGQDRRRRRRRRRDRAVRRDARRRLPRQGDLRRPARRRGRHDRGARRARRRRPRAPAGHVQRQPARDGRRAGDAARRPHPRRVRAAAPGQRRADGRLRPRDRRVRPAGAHRRDGLEGLRRDGDRADPRVPRLPGQDPPPADRAGLALPHEQRDLHDAGRRRGVDALGPALRARTCAATWRSSRRSRAT